MMKSDVYFIKIGSSAAEERVLALEKLFARVNPFGVYKKDEIIPVKLTIGDSLCVYNLSPELVKCVVAEIKKQRARPFLFDTCVIYQGQRQNAVDHLNLAQHKGFGYSDVGAPFIIADGLFGLDGKEFSLKAEAIDKIKIPSFIGMLDSLTVLTHITGHIVSGFAGAIKNVAMGMSSRSAKQIQHSSLKPSVIEKKCTACSCCLAICPAKAIALKKEKAHIDSNLCIGCGECICACKFDAIYINWHGEPIIFCKRMVEVANFILPKFKNKLFINFAFDITKECDCISDKEELMIADNLGILVSADILSIDKATSDLACQNLKSSMFKDTKGTYEAMFEYAAGKGLGNLEYNLITL